jgi:hypothetical protein
VKDLHVVITGSCNHIPERLIVCQPFLWIEKGSAQSKVKFRSCWGHWHVCRDSWQTEDRGMPIVSSGEPDANEGQWNRWHSSSITLVSLEEGDTANSHQAKHLLVCLPVLMLRCQMIGELSVAMCEGEKKWEVWKEKSLTWLQSLTFHQLPLPFLKTWRFAFLPRLLWDTASRDGCQMFYNDFKVFRECMLLTTTSNTVNRKCFCPQSIWTSLSSLLPDNS